VPSSSAIDFAAALRTAVFVEEAKPIGEVFFHASSEGQVVTFRLAAFFEGGEKGGDRQFVQIE
jgi:hypothetical protein